MIHEVLIFHDGPVEQVDLTYRPDSDGTYSANHFALHARIRAAIGAGGQFYDDEEPEDTGDPGR